ncbi:MAG: sigma 54-dependent Fis family transcriptional regulator [Candidatus Riflebacteria bacterium]|nr:sigma 54-dependent Fis family transcriptional regulator [Candidatus Riflebacteria bacterium]
MLALWTIQPAWSHLPLDQPLVLFSSAPNRSALILPKDMSVPSKPSLASTTIRLGEGADRPRLRVERVRLLVASGPDRGLELQVDRSDVRVGKGPDNDLILSDAAVSRNHFLVTCKAGRHHLVDLGSTNGTRINGVLTQEAVLDHDCTITVGSTSLLFESVAAELMVPDATPGSFHGLVGVGRAMQDLFAYLQLIATAGLSTVLQGETGSGKELVARALHLSSPRAARSFVVFDCGAANASLIDAALFGHVAGAFTGATGSRKGALLSAHGGTLFLDEIGELPMDLQPKLLRALEQREVQPLGADAPVPADVRLVCASHRNLQDMVAARQFREDLLYRLAGVTLVIPPLRERQEDIPVLAEAFLHAIRPELKFGPDALQTLGHHPWPGNVRELKNVVERVAALARSPIIGAADVVMGPLRPGGAAPDRPAALASVLQSTESELIRHALKKAGGNQSEAARKLGIARTTLRRKMAEYGIDGGGSD